MAMDAISLSLAWALFYTYRKIYLEPPVFGDIPLTFNESFYLGIIFIPAFWLLVYYLMGSYRRVYRKSRLQDLAQTLTASFLGSVLLFFALVLDDFVKAPAVFRDSFIALFSLFFLLRFIPRFLVLTYIKHRIGQRKIGFSTLLIGSGQRAKALYEELENDVFSQGYLIRGFVGIGMPGALRQDVLPHLGGLPDLQRILGEKNIEEVLIALEPDETGLASGIVRQMEGQSLAVKMIPNTADILAGRVKMKNVFGTALIEIFPELMPPFQSNVKRMLDIGLSALVLISLLPVYILIGLWVKTSSKGPIWYLQERVGHLGKPFHIIKFRTMIVEAEQGIPMLSRANDPRITPVGRLLRKYRLDELPQFFNVLVGDMSLVGPRPERQYFIDQIVLQAPEYRYLLKVRPGITSWGMVKYGYAQNVGQMIARMKYDLIYLENMSLAMDFKIFLYTVLTIALGKGK